MFSVVFGSVSAFCAMFCAMSCAMALLAKPVAVNRMVKYLMMFCVIFFMIPSFLVLFRGFYECLAWLCQVCHIFGGGISLVWVLHKMYAYVVYFLVFLAV